MQNCLKKNKKKQKKGSGGSAAQAFETVASSAPQAQCVAGACAGCWSWSTHTVGGSFSFPPQVGIEFTPWCSHLLARC